MSNSKPHLRSWRATTWAAAALVSVAVAVAGLGALPNGAPIAVAQAGASHGAAVQSLDVSADAVQPAQRLRVVPPANFPMEVSPRCDILDNFGDPRSGGRTHAGTDILATLGQEVYAMADGTLTYQSAVGDGTSGSLLSGNLWKLTAATGGTYYIYAHLSAFAPGLAKGATVYKGQLLGYVGDTGNPGAGNYHLHFEIHPGGGAAVNPLPFLTLPAGCKVY
ncbi:MAG: M23 family metallopeptidase [Actinomycetota bacterium]|nr:M23 family metallopeptidase [Actinomycetota bacterium]